MKRFVHPFLISDVLLHIVDFLLADLDSRDARNRWRQLYQIMLVNKTAYAILVERASLWRWVDLSSPNQLRLMLERSSGQQRIRPVVFHSTDRDDIDTAKRQIAEATVAFQAADRDIRPEGFFATSTHLWTQFPPCLLEPVWANLRYMSLASELASDVSCITLPLNHFTRLEILCASNAEPPAKLQSCPSLLHLEVSGITMMRPFLIENWTKSLQHFPNLHTLRLHGLMINKGEALEIALPALRNLVLCPYTKMQDVIFLTPKLEHLTLTAPLTFPTMRLVSPGVFRRIVR